MNELIAMINQPPKWEVIVAIVAQIVIISYVVAWSWQRIVGSQAERLVKGVLVIAAVWGLAYLLKFTLITTLLHTFVPVALIALVIIFQPELRRGLGHLGRMRTFRLDWSLVDADAERTRRDVDQIIAAVRELSRSKTGALIVVEPSQGERDYVSPGTTVNADISTTLLLTIFFPNSPLHDGAVVIRQDKIVAAGVILPMTDDPQLSYRYGTRHRAAIGLSETYDGLCIVVSEETGIISAASRGMLARYKDADDLHEPIMYLYTQGSVATEANPLNNFLSLFGRGKRVAGGAELLETAAEIVEEERPHLSDQQRMTRVHSIDMLSRTERLKKDHERSEGAHAESELTQRRKLSDSRIDLGDRKREPGRRKLAESQPIVGVSAVEPLGTTGDTENTDSDAGEKVSETQKTKRDTSLTGRKSRGTKRASTDCDTTQKGSSERRSPGGSDTAGDDDGKTIDASPGSGTTGDELLEEFGPVG